MIIINADDWGRSKAETDCILACFEAGRLTSTSAMVFMADSERAAEVAKSVEISVGLHLNLSELYTQPSIPAKATECQKKICHFLRGKKYHPFLFNPFLRHDFGCLFETQLQEFRRLYNREPSHIDGHQHMHLSMNMLIGGVIPPGPVVRRNFTFEFGEKSILNVLYRRLIDRHLSRKYKLADGFFSLETCLKQKTTVKVAAIAREKNVELMTHPKNPAEFEYLNGPEFLKDMQGVKFGRPEDLYPMGDHLDARRNVQASRVS